MLSFNEVKKSVNIIDVAWPYCKGLKGYQNCWTANHNPFRDEKTSSLCFYLDSQEFHDFGSNQHGDVFDFISCVENITTHEALQKIARGEVSQITHPQSTARTFKSKNLTVMRTQRSEPSPDFTAEFKKFSSLDLRNNSHVQELQEVFPKEIVNKLTSKEISRLPLRFDMRSKTLVVGIYDACGKVVCFRKRRIILNNEVKKWFANSGSKAKTSLFRIRTTSEPIFIFEGAKDGLNAALLGLDFIAVPSAGYHSFTLEELALIKGRELVFVPDTDSVGQKCMRTLAEQVQNLATTYTLNLSDFLTTYNMKELAATFNKIDFTDAFKSFCAYQENFTLSDEMANLSYQEGFLLNLRNYINQQRNSK